MKALVVMFVVSISLAHSAFSAEAMASKASIKELMKVSNAKSASELVMKPMLEELDKNFKTLYEQIRVKFTTREQDVLIKKRLGAIVNKIKKESSWEVTEAMFIPVYEQELTQKEVDGIIAFFKSPAGQAMAKKMPIVQSKVAENNAKKQMDLSAYSEAQIKELIAELEASAKK